MARGFVNLNRFKHGRAVRRDGKQKADLQNKTRVKGKAVRFRG